MKLKLTLIAVLVNLTGCSAIANYYNTQDPCQSYGKAPDYQKPSLCYTATGYTHYSIQRPANGIITVTKY